MDNVSDDFYEDDESPADILAAFDAGPHVISTPPSVNLPAGAFLVGPVPTFVAVDTYEQAASRPMVPVYRGQLSRTA